MTPGELKRFWAKVEPALDDSGCLVWTGCHGGQGYGWLREEGKATETRAVPAHRLAFEHYVGPVPQGAVLDHLCRNRLCVNWLHLDVVSRGENVMRGVGFAPANAAKTHCNHDHLYDDANTYVNPHNGWRSCRACNRERNQARYRQRMTQRNAA